ncbi:helicase SRCAP-like [Amphibalanus amphitrite]|uniref:helicase SRCAP-like n=1 Tax=Amphibalanus amphitrite TaxID=1232801 RepID=UPI001C909C7A|nr:helicase SRCAP-like [Amphibalanus amphitrite]
METAPSAPISAPAAAPISAPTLAPAASTAVLSGSAPSSIPLPLQLPVSVCIPVSSFSMTPVSVSMSVALPLVQGAVTSVQHPSAARSAPGRVAASRAAAPPPVRTSVTATPTTVMATPRAPSATRPSPACQPRRATPPTLAPAPPPQQYQVLGQPELPLVQSLPAGQIILPSGQVILTQPIQPMLQYVNAFPMQSPVLLPGGGLLQTVEEPRPVAPPPPPPTSGRRRRRKPQERSATVASMLRGAAPPAAAAPGVMNGLPTFVVGAAGKPLVLSSGQPGVNFLQPLLLPGAGGQVFIQNMSMGAPLLSAGSVFPVSAAPQVAGGQLLQVVSVLGDAATTAAPAAAAAPLVAAPPAVVQTPADSSTPDGAGGWQGRVSPPQEAGLVSSTVEPADSDTEPEETGRATLKRKRPHPDEPAQTPGFAVGDLVWGSNQGLDSWPGQVIQRTDVQPCPAGHVWVRWFGDHTMSLQTVASLRKFHTHNTAKHKKSHALNGSFEEALQEALTAVNRQRN